MAKHTISASWRTQSSVASSSSQSEIITMMFSASSSGYLLDLGSRAQYFDRHTYPSNRYFTPLKCRIQPPQFSRLRCRFLVLIAPFCWKQAHLRPSLLPLLCCERHANALVSFILRISNQFENKRLVRIRVG